ncbi:MAG: NUDIX domain-containing protein [Planctomycetes bacterium]|nr:NUDIX domain-containing protein [Planctomycetota bacterium]
MPGPKVRTDIVEVYVFRRVAQGAVEFLQLRRSKGAMVGSWQPVMGHIEEGETAAAAALRELKEETGYAVGSGLIAAWQLETVNAFFLHALDSVMLSPGFAAEVSPGVEPKLDDAHDALRWVPRDHADRLFVWPGQRQAVAQIVGDILPPGSPAENALRVALPDERM